MSEKIKLVFLGTPQIAVPVLENLSQNPDFELIAVITQPDKPAGRRQQWTPSPVKSAALKLKLPIDQPLSLNKDSKLIEKLKSLKPDFLLVFAYGQILSQEVLDLPKIKAINIHGSLLPKYRGASPIEEAILNNDKSIGISYMEMVKKMDAGPVYQSFEIPLGSTEDAQTARQQLAELAARTGAPTLLKIKNKELQAIPQNESEASYCNKIEKNDGLLDFQKESAQKVFNKFRAFQPWPGVFFKHNGKIIKLHQLELLERTDIEPGNFLIENKKLFIGTGSGALQILKLQLEGKPEQTTEQFLNGNRQFFEKR